MEIAILRQIDDMHSLLTKRMTSFGVADNLRRRHPATFGDIEEAPAVAAITKPILADFWPISGRFLRECRKVANCQTFCAESAGFLPHFVYAELGGPGCGLGQAGARWPNGTQWANMRRLLFCVVKLLARSFPFFLEVHLVKSILSIGVTAVSAAVAVLFCCDALVAASIPVANHSFELPVVGTAPHGADQSWGGKGVDNWGITRLTDDPAGFFDAWRSVNADATDGDQIMGSNRHYRQFQQRWWRPGRGGRPTESGV